MQLFLLKHCFSLGKRQDKHWIWSFLFFLEKQMKVWIYRFFYLNYRHCYRRYWNFRFSDTSIISFASINLLAAIDHRLTPIRFSVSINQLSWLFVSFSFSSHYSISNKFFDKSIVKSFMKTHVFRKMSSSFEDFIIVLPSDINIYDISRKIYFRVKCSYLCFYHLRNQTYVLISTSCHIYFSVLIYS